MCIGLERVLVFYATLFLFLFLGCFDSCFTFFSYFSEEDRSVLSLVTKMGSPSFCQSRLGGGVPKAFALKNRREITTEEDHVLSSSFKIGNRCMGERIVLG
jgi:hypothetical protein